MNGCSYLRDRRPLHPRPLPGGPAQVTLLLHFFSFSHFFVKLLEKRRLLMSF
jgi:hypothetical protein